ncbi:uncharacterized protein [Nicotiana tomentosiformis]|uniref:uncharacterized protein n=1 Tax=Nicotiana tomentosiformis TaxID=4098 RepID=UPI00388C6161
MILASIATPLAQPAQGGGHPGRGHPRGGAQSNGSLARCFAFLARNGVFTSDAVITSIALVCHRDASVLFDLGSTYSYMSSYFASYLDMPCDLIVTPIYVSIPVWDSIMVDRVYQSCVVTICGSETRADFLLLNMVYFDVILDMHWLSLYHAILDCHAKTVMLVMSSLPRLEWRGSLGDAPSRVIFLKAQQMVEKGCLAYLAFVRDISAYTPTVELVPVVKEFPDVFPVDLPCMPPDRDIDFGIDLAPDT